MKQGKEKACFFLQIPDYYFPIINECYARNTNYIMYKDIFYFKYIHNIWVEEVVMWTTKPCLCCTTVHRVVNRFRKKTIVSENDPLVLNF